MLSIKKIVPLTIFFSILILSLYTSAADRNSPALSRSQTNFITYALQPNAIQKLESKKKLAKYITEATTPGTQANNLSTPSHSVMLPAPAATTPKIAYYAISKDVDMDIYIANEDGTGKLPIATGFGDQELIFSDPLSQYIIYHDVPTGQYRIIKTDGTGTKILENTNMYGIKIVSGRVVYVRALQSGIELVSIKLDGSDKRVLASNLLPQEDFDNMGILVGNWYVYQSANSRYSIYSVKVDGSAHKLISQSNKVEVIAGSIGTRVLFYQDNRITLPDGDSAMQYDIYSVPADGSSAHIRLTSSNDDETLAGIFSDRVYFYQKKVNADDTIIGSVRADGSGTRSIIHSAQLELSGFINGRMIVSRWTANNPVLEFLGVNIDGTGVRILSSGTGVLAEGIVNNRLIYTNNVNANTSITSPRNLYSVSDNGISKIKLASNLKYLPGDISSDADIVYCLPSANRVFLRKFGSGDGKSEGNFSFTGTSTIPDLISTDKNQWLLGATSQRIIMANRYWSGRNFMTPLQSTLTNGTSLKMIDTDLHMTDTIWSAIGSFSQGIWVKIL